MNKTSAYVENISIGRPLVSLKNLISDGTEHDFLLETEKTFFTEERYLPKILVSLGFASSISELRRNRKDLIINFPESQTDFLEFKLGKRKFWVIVGPFSQ